MFVTGLLLAASTVTAPMPTSPPAPPTPPAAMAPSPPPGPATFAPPAPPLPPAPPVDLDSWGGGKQTVVSRTVDGHRVTVIAREGGASRPAALTYRDAQGRDVQVYSDRAVTREEADRLLADAKVEGERARAEGARAREAGRLAREEGARAREQAVVIRREALDEAHRAIAESGLGSRDFADLGRPREIRILREPSGAMTVDGRPFGSGFAERPEMRALRDEVRSLREELRAMRAELDRSRAGRR